MLPYINANITGVFLDGIHVTIAPAGSVMGELVVMLDRPMGTLDHVLAQSKQLGVEPQNEGTTCGQNKALKCQTMGSRIQRIRRFFGTG
jgi:hypothetical protein